MSKPSRSKEIREQILNLVKEFMVERSTEKNLLLSEAISAPVSGKVIIAEDIQFAVDACLDGWFTSGRFVRTFEENLCQPSFRL